MRKELRDIIKQLERADIQLLHRLYLFRCLTIRQAYRELYHLKYDSLLAFEEERLASLIEFGVVDKVEFNLDNHALFLTTIGVDIVRQAVQLPTEIFNSDLKTFKRGYYRAGELRLNPRLVNHQVHLNQFVLEFMALAKDYGYKWNYYDEKHVSQYFTIRPDGLIQIYDTDYFVEMDMGTESKVQLTDKWHHYRDFFRSQEYREKEKKIVVLFITENVKKMESRKDSVRYTATQALMDVFGEGFDMHIGSKAEVLQLLFEQLIPDMVQQNDNKAKTLRLLQQYHEFSIAPGERLKPLLSDTSYEYYMRRLNEDGGIRTIFGRVQEFLVDDYTSQPLSVLNKLTYHKRNANSFRLKMGRSIPYIVVGATEREIYHDLHVTDITGLENIFFTTIERLEKKHFHEALFQMDGQGNVYHFKNAGLAERVYEMNLRETSI